MLASADQRAQFIRFSLETLRERNGHHTFELICLAVARRRIASNLLPATGPVSSGGDQGRDAESHWTNLPNEIGAASSFARLATSDAVVLACTMQTDDVPSKIKKDLRTICGSGAPVDRVVYFTVTPVAVAKRHELIEHARAEHDVALDIWDAVALASHLADADLFYLAEQYLNVPAEMAPPPAEPDLTPAWYQQQRTRWRSKETQQASFGELMDLRKGLRYATFNDAARADLADWLSYARALLAAATYPEVILHAQYEIAVATLRGTDTLRPADILVRSFFEKVLQDVTDHGLLEDALVLGQYCVGAIRRGLTEITRTEIAQWHAGLLRKVRTMLDDQPYPNTRAHLLALSARLRLFPDLADLTQAEQDEGPGPAETTRRVLQAIDDDEPVVVKSVAPLFDLDGGVADLVTLCQHLPEAPLFPVDALADVFDLIAPALVDHAEYRTVRDALDEATGALAGQAAKADRARNRGMALLAAGRRREALSEIHEAKVNWWRGDTSQGAVLAMLLLSDIYLQLNMPLAAKNYALQAVMLVGSTQQHDLRIYIARGFLRAARSAYQAGTWLTAIHVAKAALAAHQAFADDPWNSERHQEVWYLLFDVATIVRVAREHRPRLAAVIDATLAEVGISDIVDGILGEAEADADVEWPEQTIVDSAGREGVGRPFSDAGATRTYTWSALGTTWIVTSANERHAGLAAERFAAAAQVVLVELADQDAVLLPSRIEIEIRADAAELAADADRVEQLPDNDASRWLVHLSRADALDINTIHREMATTLVTVLHTSSLLPFEAFMTVMEKAFQRGLFHKLAIGRPFDEVADLLPEAAHPSVPAVLDEPLGAGIEVGVAAADELGPPTTPGPGYEHKEALEAVRRRYANTLPTLRYTLPRLLADAGFRTVVANLRTEGWLDWHLLNAIASLVAFERVRRSGLPLPPRTQADAEMLHRVRFHPEEPDDVRVPPREFTEDALRMQLNASVLVTLTNFDLQTNQRTPNFGAIFDLLGRRYGYWTDDVEHDDVFPEAP
ncbi:hypothetical protein ACFO1B_44030 [Dactylosporangium siamense]